MKIFYFLLIVFYFCFNSSYSINNEQLNKLEYIKIVSCPIKFFKDGNDYCDTIFFTNFLIVNTLEEIKKTKTIKPIDIDSIYFISCYLIYEKSVDSLKISNKHYFLFNNQFYKFDSTLFNVILESIPYDHYIIYKELFVK
jgi:hypothetical protein